MYWENIDVIDGKNIKLRWNAIGTCFYMSPSPAEVCKFNADEFNRNADEFNIVENMIKAGRWKVRNGEVIDLCLYADSEKYDSYCIVSNKDIYLHLYYDKYGKCQNQIKTGQNQIKTGGGVEQRCNNDDLESWDLIERVNELEVVIKRNSNPIFMLDLCTE
jgi:hypothetical protein